MQTEFLGQKGGCCLPSFATYGQKKTDSNSHGLSIQGSTDDNTKGGPLNLGLYEDNKVIRL